MQILKGNGLRYWQIKKYKSIALIVFLAFFFGLSVICLIPLSKPLFKVDYATSLFDKNGILLGSSIPDDEQWRFSPLDSIPDKFEKALLLFEDEYFFYHPGINPVSIFKAILVNAKAGKTLRGGSTISMQTIRLSSNNPRRNYKEKIIEICKALKLEFIYSKSEILNLYVSHAPFGGNIVGLNAASWFYYGRAPTDLSWSEAASLAVLPNDPSSVYPGGDRIKYLKKRDLLIDKLLHHKYIDSTECFLAKQEPLPEAAQQIQNSAFHLLQTLKSKGFEGQSIHSSVDATIQGYLNSVVQKHAMKLSHNQIHNIAALIIHVRSSCVTAYVGNTGSNPEHSPFVDVVQAKRSPGSLLKPFLYAASIDEGLILPYQFLPDIPMIYRGFAPKNFDKKFRGAIPADNALSGSLNVPFVFLLREYGYEKLHQKLKDIGMSTLDKPANHYGLSIILGGAECTLWEISSMYAGMVRIYNEYPARAYRAGYHSSDFNTPKILKDAISNSHSTMEMGHYSYASISYTLQALKSLQRPEEESGWERFNSSKHIAWKTGTSFGFKDAWAIGCSNEYVVGIWVGNADGEGRPGLVGVRAAAPLMFEIFDFLPGNAEFKITYGEPVSVCKKSGMKSGDHCEERQSILLPQNLMENEICRYHQTIHLDKHGNSRVNSSCYPVDDMTEKSYFTLPPVQAWYYKRYNPNYEEVPGYRKDCDFVDNRRSMQMVYPNNNSKIVIPLEQNGQRGEAIFEASHSKTSTTIYWHLDEEYIGLTDNLHQKGIRAEKGSHILTLIDELGNELKTSFEVVN